MYSVCVAGSVCMLMCVHVLCVCRRVCGVWVCVMYCVCTYAQSDPVLMIRVPGSGLWVEGRGSGDMRTLAFMDFQVSSLSTCCFVMYWDIRYFMTTLTALLEYKCTHLCAV